MPSANREFIIGILTNPDNYQHVKYEIGELEYLRAIKHLPPVKSRIRFVMAFSILILIFALWMFAQGAREVAIFFILIAAIYPILIRYIFRSFYRKAYRTMHSSFSAPIELIFGQGFIAQHTAVIFSYLTSLYQVKITREFRLLGTSSQMYIIVPVRAFENPMALAEFDNITSDLAQGRVVGR